MNKLVWSHRTVRQPGFEYGKKSEVPAMVKLMRYTLPTFMVRQSLAPAYGDPAVLTDDGDPLPRPDAPRQARAMP